MADAKTTQQKMREQIQVAENTAQRTLQAWNDVALATAEWTFHVAEQNLRMGQELRAQGERVAQESFATYRRTYEEGLRSWQGYVQNVNETFTRVINQ